MSRHTQYPYICGQHDMQPFMPIAYIFVAMLQASWVDKQVRFTRGRVFTDTILNKSDLNKVRKSQEWQEWHLDAIMAPPKGPFNTSWLWFIVFIQTQLKNAFNCSPEYLYNNGQRGDAIMLKVWALTRCEVSWVLKFIRTLCRFQGTKPCHAKNLIHLN